MDFQRDDQVKQELNHDLRGEKPTPERKRESSLKLGIQGKRLQAGRRRDYLLKVRLS